MIQPPKHHSVGSFHVLEWEQYKIKAEVSRIYEDSHYTTFAEILFKATVPDSPEFITQTRLNMTSDTAMLRTAKNLTERFGEKIPWADMITQLCRDVLAAHRQGEPMVMLSECEEEGPVEFLVDPLIVKGYPNILFGDGDTNKTTTAGLLALLVDTPWNHAGLEGEPTNVVVLDYEMDRSFWIRLTRSLRKGMGIETADSIAYRRCYMPLSQDIETIQRMVVENEVGLLVVDSAIGAAGAAIEESSTAQEYFRALRALNVTSLTICHETKEGKGEKPFGSGFWYHEARNIWLTRKGSVQDNKVSIGLFHRKGNLQKRAKPIGLEYTYHNPEIQVRRTKVQDDPELIKSIGYKEQIQAALRVGKLTLQEIADMTGIPKATCNTVLYRGQREADPVFGKDGSYYYLRTRSYEDEETL